jgi:hypothetical protein
MANYIKIERLPYEEPYHLQLVWSASNGNVSACFDYYDNAESLIEIAEHLEQFPRHKDDVFLFEIGSEKAEDRFAYYFRFRLFTTDLVGNSAIQIRFSNNNELPYREIVEFCIRTEPASLNRLGNLFREFAKLQHDYLAWSESEAFVGAKHEYLSTVSEPTW